MSSRVQLLTLAPRPLAAVSRSVAPGAVGREFRAALDLVWAHLRATPGLRGDGHNVFLYHHDGGPSLRVDFGVEVLRAFEPAGEVRCVWTPGGEAATAVHRGPYEGLGATHDAVRAWCKEQGREVGSHSLEVYGDWHEDPARLETTVHYLLR